MPRSVIWCKSCVESPNQAGTAGSVSWRSGGISSQLELPSIGGRALKFYSSIRAGIRRIGAIKDGDEVTGNRTKVKMMKNKVASPFREAEFDIVYGEGISKVGDLIDLGVEHNLLDNSGSW